MVIIEFRKCISNNNNNNNILNNNNNLAGSEYVRRHDKALEALAVQWAIDNGMLPSGTKWYRERWRWEKGKVIENNGKKLYWDWEHCMINSCTARRPDLMHEDSRKIEILLIDMACPNEFNKDGKQEEKIRKY